METTGLHKRKNVVKYQGAQVSTFRPNGPHIDARNLHKNAAKNVVKSGIKGIMRENARKQSFSDLQKAVKAEIKEAINASLERSKDDNIDHLASFKVVEKEISSMLESVKQAKLQDNLRMKHNEKMKVREQLIFILGMFFLTCPGLLLFNMAMTLFPKRHIQTLEYAAQQVSAMGATSRFCLRIILIARNIDLANSGSGGAYLSGTMAALVILLLVLRHAAVRRTVMTPHQKGQVQTIQRLIQEELENRRS